MACDARRLAELALLFVKEVTYTESKYMHDFGSCPKSNLEYNESGLRRGCLLCLLLKAIEEAREGD